MHAQYPVSGKVVFPVADNVGFYIVWHGMRQESEGSEFEAPWGETDVLSFSVHLVVEGKTLPLEQEGINPRLLDIVLECVLDDAQTHFSL